MNTSASSEELDTSIESVFSSNAEEQTLSTPLRPSPFTLRSQCSSGRCPHGTGIVFRSRISPSPGKTRVRSRRRRRSDQQNINDSSSILEISHVQGHTHLQEHQHDYSHLSPRHEHYPHDGIHNIDHHHVHLQNLQLHDLPQSIASSEKQLTRLHRQDIFRGLQEDTENYYLNPDQYLPTRADILFEEMQNTEEQRLSALKECKEKSVTTKETVTTVRRTLDMTANGNARLVDSNSSSITNIAEGVKNFMVGCFTPQKETTLENIAETREPCSEEYNKGDKRECFLSNEVFKPAREFFEESPSREQGSDYFSGSDTPSKLRASTRRLSLRKPFNQYIAYSSDEEFDDWKQQPKSDYTYSASLTYRQRVTPDRKIGSPNMSRRTLKGGTISFVGTPEFSESDEVSSNTWDLRSRTVLKPMDALSDGSDAEENAEQQLPSTRSRRSTRSRSHDLPRSNGSLTRTITTVSTEYTTSRTLHHGLDADSDVDDGTESGVPVRATPILARGGTPLGRAITPLPTLKLSSSRRSSTSSVDVGKGFILREGTIAEDVEVDEETPKDLITRWSHTITTITTVITASIAMVATSAVNAISGSSSSKGKLEGNEKSTISRYSSVMKSKWSAFCDHLRKKPILIWIPLLFILLLLSLLTYWWLLQSRGKTAGDSDPTENDGPSFFSALLLLVSDFSYQIYSGLCSVLNVIWLMTTNSFSWLINAVYDSALYCYESISAMCIWLGASTISVLSWCWSWIAFICALLLQWLNLAGEYVKFCALGIYNTLLSLATYMYGLLTFSTPVVSGIHEGTREDSIGIVAWITKISPMERISDMYLAVAEGAHSSGNILWNIWLWLVISMGEIFSAAASYLLWGLSSILAACLFLLTGLWTFLTFIWGNLVSFLWAVAAPFSLMLKSSSSVSTIPIAKPVIQPVLTDVSHPKIEEIVQQVLGSEKLIDHITASIAKAHEGQLTYDGVTAAARLVIEQELTVVKEEMASVKKEISTDAATSEAQQYMIVQLQKEKTNLIKELQMLGQRLFSVEGKINAADARSLQENLEIVKQINKLEMDHKDLAADVKSCCDEEKLPLLIGKIFGISSDELMDNGKPDIAAWLENYFVAKKELAVKLDELMATMKVKDSDQVIVSQTRDIVMSTVLAQLQENMKAHQQQFSAEAKLQISAQVESQVKGAVGSLEKEVIDQVVKQVNLKNLQLKDNVKEKVSEAVQEHYKSVVDAAIRKAVDEAVNTAVPNAVGKSLPEILMNILPSLVLEEVTASVPEVVASVVPAAVSAAISEATNHESQHEAKEETMEGTKEKMGNEIVGITGSGSANMTIESNGGSAFISGMDLAGGLNKTEVLKIVDDALKKYDADKTGMVDHALESAGGNIVSTRCTESYQVHQAEVRVLGFPIYWYSTNNPRTIIQPETLPGQCWAFKGSQGFVVIQLAGEVQPTGFTLEHIPKSLTPNGAIDSAPREFEVFGLTQENDLGEKLGDYVYTDNGNALQYFPVQENNSDYYPFIELKIKSNHGNIHYTCLYRFRVHGLRRLL